MASIPLKDSYLVEMIRGAVLWSIWLARNKLCFQGVTTNPRAIGSQIIAFTNFWCKCRNDGSLFKLSLILPSDILKISVQTADLMVQGDIAGMDMASSGLLHLCGTDLSED